MSKYKFLVVMFCLFALAVSANAQSNTATFQWTRDEAQFYVDNYTSLTTPPPVYDVYNSSGTYSFVQSNAANANFANWGSYLVPTGRQGYLVISADPKDDAVTDVINKTGITIRVKFLR